MPVNLLAEISANKFVKSIKLTTHILWLKIPPRTYMADSHTLWRNIPPINVFVV
jgi:hypothetical protein